MRIPPIHADDDTLTAALRMAAAGIYVGPVDAKTKHAGSRLGKGWPAKTSRDPEVIVSWFAGTDDALFIHPGRSGLVAFDVDRPEALPDALRRHLVAGVPFHSTRAETPGRGHWFFQQPAGRMLGNSTGKLGGAWGEVRGRNGIVVVAPSVHSSGGRYLWHATGDVPAMPADLAAQLPDGLEAADAVTDAEVEAFMARHISSVRPGLFRAVISRWNNELGAGASRHMTALGCMSWAMREARAGYYPARLAHDEIKERFLLAMSAQRGPTDRVLPPVQAAGEWSGIAAWSIALAEATNLAEVRRHANTASVRRLIGVSKL